MDWMAVWHYIVGTAGERRVVVASSHKEISIPQLLQCYLTSPRLQSTTSNRNPGASLFYWTWLYIRLVLQTTCHCRSSPPVGSSLIANNSTGEILYIYIYIQTQKRIYMLHALHYFSFHEWKVCSTFFLFAQLNVWNLGQKNRPELFLYASA